MSVFKKESGKHPSHHRHRVPICSIIHSPKAVVPQLDIVLPLSLPWIWSADVQRQTALSLARQGHMVHIYQANEGAFWLDRLWRSFTHTPQSKANSHLSFHQPIYIFPDSSHPLIHNINRFVALKIFSIWMQLISSRPQLLWLCALEHYYYPAFFPNWRNLYYCSDYFNFEKSLTSSAKEREVQETTLLRQADFAFVNSHTLHALHRGKRRKLHIVSHGFCVDDFQQPHQVPVIKKKKRLLLGYVGGISERMDWQLLETLVTEHPEWDFAFYYPATQGPSKAASLEFGRLIQYKNVIHGTTSHRRELAGYMKQFDVGIIPYDSTRLFNRYCFPMKIYEYFYLGIPVISTLIDELERYPQYVYLSNSPRQWVKQIQALERTGWPAKKKREQKKIALANTWDRKTATVLERVWNESE